MIFVTLIFCKTKMSDGKKGIAEINLRGLYKSIGNQYTFIDSIRELIDNSKDANATHVQIILKPNLFCVIDNGVGMSKEIIESRLLNFFKESTDENKIGSKGVGLKTSLEKLSCTTNHSVFTKQIDSKMYEVNMAIEDAIKLNDLGVFGYHGLTVDSKEMLEKVTEIQLKNFKHGTIVLIANPNACANITAKLAEEADENESMETYIKGELSRTYANILTDDFQITVTFDEKSVDIQPTTLLHLANYNETLVCCGTEQQKKFFAKIQGVWKRIRYTSKEQPKNEALTGDEPYSFTLCHNPKQHKGLGGVYLCRQNKITKRSFVINENTGDFDYRNLINDSIFIIKFSSSCDELFGTGINKSESDIQKSKYCKNSIEYLCKYLCKQVYKAQETAQNEEKTNVQQNLHLQKENSTLPQIKSISSEKPKRLMETENTTLPQEKLVDVSNIDDSNEIKEQVQTDQILTTIPPTKEHPDEQERKELKEQFSKLCQIMKEILDIYNDKAMIQECQEMLANY